ncbi:hypothetical protein Mrose_03390 [Calidithermus roseus]|uniref:Uncharacterized protein n=1 Tax=Calidithermus roseus TaxID=1644118 RepID=A0A399EEN6_9DEIN|nr:hypothetical protein Mrose_03390 [Calidithermus roseus]
MSGPITSRVRTVPMVLLTLREISGNPAVAAAQPSTPPLPVPAPSAAPSPQRSRGLTLWLTAPALAAIQEVMERLSTMVCTRFMPCPSFLSEAMMAWLAELRNTSLYSDFSPWCSGSSGAVGSSTVTVLVAVT